jgi:serine protease Do
MRRSRSLAWVPSLADDVGRRGILLVVVFVAGAAFGSWRAPPSAQAAAGGGPPDFADVIAAAEPAVAHVTTVLPGERAPGSRDDAVGAGFVLAAEGLIVTSRHVIQGAREVHVSLPGRPTVRAEVLGGDEATDVAVLRIPASGLPMLPTGETRTLRPGRWVLAVGSPYHLPRSWSVGIVSAMHRSQVGVSLRGYEDFLQTDAAANVGNSGGPLLDANGLAVGMVTAILSRTGTSQGVSLAVPIEVVLDVARRIAGGGGVARASLGVVVREVEVPGGASGLEITRFHAGSPGAAAGLRVGDVLVAVEGVRTPRTPDLQRAIWERAAGAAVAVDFLRAGRTLRVSVVLR